jgi:hypothetical protein
MTPCNLVKIYWRFGGTCGSILTTRKPSTQRSTQHTKLLYLLLAFSLARLTFRPCRWRQYVPSKRRYTLPDYTTSYPRIYSLQPLLWEPHIPVLTILITFLHTSMSILFLFKRYFCRPQWPHGIRHEPSSPARTLGSWVRVRLFCVCVVLCVGCRLATGWSPYKESYRLCVRLRNWKYGQGPQGL